LATALLVTGVIGAVVAPTVAAAPVKPTVKPVASSAHAMRVKPSGKTPLRPMSTPQPQLEPQGGPVQNTPKVYVVFWNWTSDPSGEQAYLTNFLSDIGGSKWANTVLQYGGSMPTNLLQGTWSDPSPIPSTPTEGDLATEAVNAAQHFGIADSVNNQIVVATPTGHSVSGFGTDFCAKHLIASSSTYTLPFTDFPYNTDSANCGKYNPKDGTGGLLDGVSIVEGHELAEVITDPLVSGWWDSGGYEIGDKCSWIGLGTVSTPSGVTFPVQPLWSDNSASCQLETTPTAAVPTIGSYGTSTNPGSGNDTVFGGTNLQGDAGFSWIEYGTTTAYGKASSIQSIAAAQNTFFSNSLTGLIPGTTYHYRAHVANNAGVAVMADSTFVPYGIYRSGLVVNPGNGNETVYGSAYLDAPNTTATVQLSYGTTSGYGSTTQQYTITANASGLAVFTLPLTNLTPKTTYHYSISLTSADHVVVVNTADATFVAVGLPTLTGVQAEPDAGSGNETVFSQADLVGDANASYHLNYGTTTSYGTTTATQSVNNNYPSVTINRLTGLTVGTTYHYQLVLINSAGTVTYPDQTFTATTVSVGQPLIGGLTGNGQAGGGGLISGLVYLQGASSATVVVNYGTTSSYESSTSPQTIQAGNIRNGATPLSISFSGLTPGAVYHYSVSLNNGAGVANSVDRTFVNTPS
jgi:hypothetical protein